MTTPAPNYSKVLQSGSGFLLAQTSDGQTVKVTGDLNWRNNNPGNLEASAWTQRQRGYIGDGGARFAIFDTYENGRAAKQNLLFKNDSYKGLTISQAITRYAPPKENPTQSYINSVTKALGVSADTPMSSLSVAQQQTMLDAMQKVEGFRPGQVTLVDNTSNTLPTPSTRPATPPVEPPTHPGSIDSITPQDVTTSYTGVIPNPLLKYPSYTYGLSLHMLTPSEYTEIVKKQNHVAKRVIVASAGRHNSTTFVRHPEFREDFFFDNLSMTTVIGLNANSRSTNAIDIKFSIIEPHGLTFLDRIIHAAAGLRVENYLELPYLLQIDFYAMDDLGQIASRSELNNHTKKIPIRILTMDIKTSAKGSEYSITACPYNHSAYNLNTLTAPINMGIVAGTLKEFFQTDEPDVSTFGENDSIEQREDAAKNASYKSTLADGTPIPAMMNGTVAQQEERKIAKSKPQTYMVKSYGSGINKYYEDLAKTNKINFPDKYYFQFYGELNTAKFELHDKMNPDDRAMGDISSGIAMKSNLGSTVHIPSDKKAFAVNAGTSLDQVLNYAVRYTNYIQDQFSIPEEHATTEGLMADKKTKENSPAMWFKTVPTIELGDYDPVTKAFQRTITYHIIPYKTYNAKLSFVPQGTTTSPLKVYNYYYTGKNIDVIDLDIQFNATYYTSITAYKTNMAKLANLPNKEIENQEKDPDIADAERLDRNIIQPMAERVGPINSQDRNSNESTPRAAATIDFQNSLYNNPNTEMLSVKLKIVGDPTFIKQDDVFYPPVTGKVAGTEDKVDLRLTPNQSIKTDSGEIYVEVHFRSPVDVNEMTGFMRFEPEKYYESKFSGLYRIITVDSTFSNGQFEQVLELVRLPRQDSPVKPSDAANQERSESKPKNSAVVLSPAEAEQFNKLPDTDEAVPPKSNPDASESPADPPVTEEQKKLMENAPADSDATPITQANEPTKSDVSTQTKLAKVDKEIYDNSITINRLTQAKSLVKNNPAQVAAIEAELKPYLDKQQALISQRTLISTQG